MTAKRKSKSRTYHPGSWPTIWKKTWAWRQVLGTRHLKFDDIAGLVMLCQRIQKRRDELNAFLAQVNDAIIDVAHFSHGEMK